MRLTQSWVGAIDRGYEQIKRSLLTRLGIVAPEISDHTESNPLIIIISMFAGIGEMLNLYIDAMYREAFIGTARRYSSAVKLVKLIDYQIKAANPASVNLLFYLVDGGGVATPLGSGSVTLLSGSIIYANNSDSPFKLTQDVVFQPGDQSKNASALQYDNVAGDILGLTTGVNNELFQLPPNYVHNTLEILVGAIPYIRYNSFSGMFPTTKGFIVNINEDGKAFVQFGDGVNGLVPPGGQTVFGTYKITDGVLGNLPPGSFGTIDTPPVVPGSLVLKVLNSDYASGGTDFESLEDIQNRAPRSIRTLDRAVTYQDYKDLAILVPGVGDAEVKFCCGKYVDVYVVPNSPGVASIPLLAAVQAYLDCRAMLTTRIDVLAAGVTKIYIKAKIYSKPLVEYAKVWAEVLEAADAEYGYNKIEINRKIAITDIITLWKGLSSVDNVEIEQVSVLPYPRALESTINPLLITFNTLPNTATKYTYTIIYRSGINQFEIYRDTYLITTVAAGVTVNEGWVAFTINAGSYTNNDKWEFVVFPSYPEIFPSTELLIKDYSAPIIEVSPFIDDGTPYGAPRTIYGDITIIPQGTSTSCLPACP